MCILADALLEDFFESDLTASWRLDVLVPEEKPKPQTIAGGWWREIVNAVTTDENKVSFIFPLFRLLLVSSLRL